jgi:hypothetical protein
MTEQAALGSAAPNSNFVITRMVKAGGPLTKRVSLLSDGSTKSDGSACIMSAGNAHRVHLTGAADLADLIGNLESNEAITLGALRPDLPDVATVVTKRRLDTLNGVAPPNMVARTGDHIGYRPGKPGFALLDFDQKGMPPSVHDRLAELGGFTAAIRGVLPGMADAGHALRASTSAGLYRTDTGERFASSGGMHLFLAVADGADIPRFLDTLHARCWLAGLGWMMVGAAGQLLERSIVDRMVGAPERLVFEARPILDAPLSQDAALREPVSKAGPPLDTIAACPPLTILEQSRLKELRAREAHRLAPDSAKARAAFVAHQAATIAKRTGITSQQAVRVAERQCAGVLLPHVVLPWDDAELAGATVAEVLADPARFAGATLADPLEGVEYGPTKAMIMRRADGTPWVHSFAHGRTIYPLLYDAAAIAAAIAKAPPAEAADVFVRLAVNADLDGEESDALRNQVAERTGTGKRVIAAKLNNALQAKAARDEQELRQRRAAERCDPRPQIPAPPPDAPWLPQMHVLNEVLGGCTDPEPPMRDADGAMIQVRLRGVAALHALTAKGSNGEDTDETRLPPPEQPLLTRLGEVELAELIERHIEHVDDKGRAVHLGAPFVRHFLIRSDRVLPTVTAVATLPMVLPDGTILSGAGLDRKRGIVFRVPPELERLLPALQDCTPTCVAEAMQFLTDEWLRDVATDYAGKCVLIAAACSVLERLLFSERPAYFVTAGQRGGGKTTVINMIATAVLGMRAAAAGWSGNEEERRKALLSYLGEGLPMLVWDNLPRGLQISCPTIEKCLTTDAFCDRVLGVSETRTVPAYTLQMFTGNNVGPRGDMASRSLTARLSVDRPDPENRAFTHADPIEWTARHRGSILKALYTVLLGNPRLRERKPKQAQTRFKGWWHLIGSAIEHAARAHTDHVKSLVLDPLNHCPPVEVSFREMFKAGESVDEQGSSLATILETLARRWPSGCKAAELVPYVGAASDEGVALRGAIEAATSKAMPSVSSVSLAWRLKSLTDAPVNIDGRTLVLRYMAGHEGGSFVVRAL